MRAVSLILLLGLTPCSGHPAFAKATTYHFSCTNIPWWVKNYSIAQINPVLVSLGMTRWQIVRLDKCLARTNDPSYSIGP